MTDPSVRFAALGDPIRLAIVRALGESGPLPTVRLHDQARQVSRQGLAKHMAVLERAGLIERRRAGRDLSWRLQADGITALRDMLDTVSAAWDTRIERLRALVED